MPSSWMIAVGHVGGALVATIGLHAATWYLSNSEPVGWFGTPTPMALSTGVAFAISGACMFSLATAIDMHVKRCHPGTKEA